MIVSRWPGSDCGQVRRLSDGFLCTGVEDIVLGRRNDRQFKGKDMFARSLCIVISEHLEEDFGSLSVGSKGRSYCWSREAALIGPRCRYQ